jgi:DNA-directed RNA polymerase specialized sigma24 family protein
VPTETSTSGPEAQGGTFATTHWSVVLAAGQQDTPQSATALDQLCRTYWYPLYAHVRRRGYATEDAKDLTQEFFARLLARQWLGMADPGRGRFRTFLLAALDHFLANEWHRGQRQKRGGGCEILSRDQDTFESRYLAEPVCNATPELIYQQRWAATLLDRVLERLREEYVAAGKAEFFEAVKSHLWGERSCVSLAQLAADAKVSEGAMKVAIHRVRRRYRELLRYEIAQTVAHPAEVDAELRDLIAVLRGEP